MSFARAKITRFNEKPGPGTGITGTKSCTPRSQIPKITKTYGFPGTPREADNASRSKLEQQKSKSGCNQNINDTITKPFNLSTLNENSVASDDFKDALEKVDADGSDILKDCTQISLSIKQDSMASKTSVSGIPLPLTPTIAKTPPKLNRKPTRSESRDSTKASPTRNSLEYQFLSKKKRLEQMKKDLEAKQKPFYELYESMVELKKRLEENGKMVTMEAIKLIDYNDGNIQKDLKAGNIEQTAGEEGDVTADAALETSAQYLANLQTELEPIPMTFSELGKYLMCTRDKLIEHLTKIKEGLIEKEEADLDQFEQETKKLNGLINDAIERQETRVKRILNEAQSLMDRSNNVTVNQTIRSLEVQLKQANDTLNETTEVLNDTQRQLKDLKEGQLHRLSDDNNTLKEKVKSLDAELKAKSKKISENVNSNKTYEQKMENLNKQLHEMDKGKKEAENKVNDMNAALRNLQMKLKNMEQKWREEKEEILKNHKGEHAILEKLTAERQALDTRHAESKNPPERVHLMNTILDEQKRTNDEEQCKLKKEIAVANEDLQTTAIERQILEDKLESLKQEIAHLTVQQQQAVEVMKNSISDSDDRRDDSYVSEREAQLRTELLAMRVALKAAQERIENYTTEKMRFIDSIERLNGDGESTKESLGRALVQKEEMITSLEQEKAAARDTIEFQKVQISQLSAKIDNLQAGAIVNRLDTLPRDTQELKAMLEEGKAKLQKALAKSLDNEQKLIKYEHDINQQKKQLNDMENLLKVRDGLIGMLKAKKDELLLENESLHKYSEEVRQLLFDTKEELKQKAEMIHELSGSLDGKSRLCYKLEKKIKELEATLSETNEKRFKLQESVGTMEKELQSTKAHMTQIAEMQTRYDLGMPDNIDNEQQYLDPSTYDDDDYYHFACDNLADECIVTKRQPPAQPPTSLGNNRNLSVISVRESSRGYDDNGRLDEYEAGFEHVEHNNPFSTKMTAVRRYVLPSLRNDQCVGDVASKADGDRYATEQSRAVETTPYYNYLRQMYYYVRVPRCDLRAYANYIRRISPLTCAPVYRYCYRVLDKQSLSQSLMSIGTSRRLDRSLQRSNAQIQTKFCSGEQTEMKTVDPQFSDSKLTFLVYPKSDVNFSSGVNSESSTVKDNPYKICCDILSKENQTTNTGDNLETVPANDQVLPESKLRERREFITIVNKLCKYDKRGREKLGLGKEFTPIVFGGVSRYKVMNNGSLMWCRPSKEMELNNMLITKDIKAHKTLQSNRNSTKLGE